MENDNFVRPSITVDCILFTIRNSESENYRKLPEKKLQILLTKRAEAPFKNKWCLPGSFVGKEERFEESVNRVLKKKTNIKDIYLEQLYSWSDPYRDPRVRVISTSYLGLINSDDIKIKAGKNMDDIQWFDIKVNVINENNIANENGYYKEEEIEVVLELLMIREG